MLSVSANECNGDCIIKKGQEFVLSAEFISNQDTNKINIAITANVNGLQIPVPGAPTDGCTVVKCPLKKGEQYSFTYKLPVLKSLPSIPHTDVFAKFNGDHGNIACLQLKGSITD